MRTAIGLIAGPETPPVWFARSGFRRRTSMAIPTRVLINEIASAPASSTAAATEAILAAPGLSLTMSGNVVAERTARVTSADIDGSQPKQYPPRAMFGQETLTSMAAIDGCSSRMAAIMA